MATTELERLIVTLEASTKQYERALAKAQGTTVSAMKKIEKATADSARRQATIFATMGKDIQQGFMSQLRGIGPAIVASMGFAAVVNTIGGAIKALAELGDQAADFGMPVAELQTWNRLAIESGQSSELMAKALSQIGEQSGDADSALAKLFNANNVKMSADITKNMLAFVDILQRARSPAEQLGIAADVLGKKVSRGLLEALKEGPDAFVSKFKEMEQAGQHFTEEQIRQTRELETNWNAFTSDLTTSFQQFVLTSVKEFQFFVAAYNRGIEAMKKYDFTQTGAYYLYKQLFGGTSPPSFGTRPGAGANITGGSAATTTTPSIRTSEAEAAEDAAKAAAEEAENRAELIARLRDETNARSENVTMTEEQIEATLSHANNLRDEANALAESQAEIERINDLNNIARTSLQGFTQDLIDGTSAADAFRNMLSKLADQLVNLAFQQLFAGPTGAQGGLLGSLLGLKPNAKGGTYRVGGSSREHPVALSAQRGEMITVTPASKLRSGGMNGPASISTGQTVIHINGAADERVVAMMDRRIQENNVRQRQALQREWGSVSMQYSRLRGP